VPAAWVGDISEGSKLHLDEQSWDSQPLFTTQQLFKFGRDFLRANQWAAGAYAKTAAPIPMVLHCPKCGEQHIDKPEGQFYPGQTATESALTDEVHGLWCNPPHRSHLCHGCGHIWRPADVPTTGVAAVQTKGKNDSPLAMSADAKDAARYRWLRGEHEAISPLAAVVWKRNQKREGSEWVNTVGPQSLDVSIDIAMSAAPDDAVG